ncbi:MAG TPA: YicC/YloC family endoribonuclease [Geobacteraceae bacterium]
MIRSMTGYGKAEAASAGGRIVAEIRAVNHRYGEIFVKLPRPFMAFENEVRKCVAGRLKRGKIEVFVQLEGGAGPGALPVLNVPLARAYHGVFVRIKEELGLADPVTLALIASQRDVLAAGESEELSELLREELLSAVAGAVESLDAMRLREGATLLDDLRERRATLSTLIGRVAECAPRVVAEAGKRLKERVAQLAGESGVDEGRLAQEIAFMADRGDITEELVRFGSHLLQLDETLLMEEPVGRKLDFLLQELNREVNTIGSKANDAEVAATVVQLKAELEKIREQVQNIE